MKKCLNQFRAVDFQTGCYVVQDCVQGSDLQFLVGRDRDVVLTGMTSSLTRWSRMTWALDFGAKWQRTAS